MIPRRRFLSFFVALPFLRPAKAVVPAKKPPPPLSMKDWNDRMKEVRKTIAELTVKAKALNASIAAIPLLPPPPKGRP